MFCLGGVCEKSREVRPLIKSGLNGDYICEAGTLGQYETACFKREKVENEH